MLWFWLFGGVEGFFLFLGLGLGRRKGEGGGRGERGGVIEVLFLLFYFCLFFSFGGGDCWLSCEGFFHCECLEGFEEG